MKLYTYLFYLFFNSLSQSIFLLFLICPPIRSLFTSHAHPFILFVTFLIKRNFLFPIFSFFVYHAYYITRIITSQNSVIYNATITLKWNGFWKDVRLFQHSSPQIPVAASIIYLFLTDYCRKTIEFAASCSYI